MTKNVNNPQINFKTVLRGWEYRPNRRLGLVHLHHNKHGVITIRPTHPSESTAKDHAYTVMHNGQLIGRFNSPHTATLGAINHVKTITAL